MTPLTNLEARGATRVPAPPLPPEMWSISRGWSFHRHLPGPSRHTCGAAWAVSTRRPVNKTMAYLGGGARRWWGGRTRSWRTTSASSRVSRILLAARFVSEVLLGPLGRVVLLQAGGWGSGEGKKRSCVSLQVQAPFQTWHVLANTRSHQFW